MKLEAWAFGITAGSREVPGRKCLWQETSISYNNDDDDDNNNNNNVTVLWNQTVHTDREVTANRPDIIIKNKKEKTATHRHITKYFNAIIEELEKAPDWLTTWITYLIPKSGDSKEVRNCRPITCLTTMYKTLTGIIAKRISTHLEEHYYYYYYYLAMSMR